MPWLMFQPTGKNCLEKILQADFQVTLALLKYVFKYIIIYLAQVDAISINLKTHNYKVLDCDYAKDDNGTMTYYDVDDDNGHADNHK